MTATYLVTGGTRGIGAGIVDTLLRQPDVHVVVGVREPSAAAAKKLSARANVTVVRIDSKDDESPFAAANELQSKGIKSIDVVFANAGIATLQQRGEVVDVKGMHDMIQVNTFAPLLLYLAFKPLLQEAASPVFAVTSSLAGSLAREHGMPYNMIAYGSSKAAVNMVVREMSFEEPWLTAVTIHPGVVATDMGESAMGKEGIQGLLSSGAAITAQDSAERMVKLVQSAKHDTHSGHFFDVQNNTKAAW